MIEAFLFDLDGTLVTMEFDVAMLRKEIATLFAEYGIKDYIFTKPLLESLSEVESGLQARGTDTTPLRGTVMSVIEGKEKEGALRTRPIGGARSLLLSLKERRIRVGVVTRTNRQSALLSLERCGISSLIDILLARDDVENLKPHPSHILAALERLGTHPSRCVMVGDHAMDIEVGKKVGCVTVGVLSGTGTRDTLAGADYILPDVSYILDSLPF